MKTKLVYSCSQHIASWRRYQDQSWGLEYWKCRSVLHNSKYPTRVPCHLGTIVHLCAAIAHFARLALKVSSCESLRALVFSTWDPTTLLCDAIPFDQVQYINNGWWSGIFFKQSMAVHFSAAGVFFSTGFDDFTFYSSTWNADYRACHCHLCLSLQITLQTKFAYVLTLLARFEWHILPRTCKAQYFVPQTLRGLCLLSARMFLLKSPP